MTAISMLENEVLDLYNWDMLTTMDYGFGTGDPEVAAFEVESDEKITVYNTNGVP